MPQREREREIEIEICAAFQWLYPSGLEALHVDETRCQCCLLSVALHGGLAVVAELSPSAAPCLVLRCRS